MFPRELTTDSGLELSIRRATPKDAGSLAELARDASATSADLPGGPDEFRLGEDVQRRWLSRASGDSRLLALVAETGPVVCGQLDFSRSEYRRLMHHGTLGMGVHSQWRGQGIGSALLFAFLNWATARDDLERVFLEVSANNETAARLCRSMGFEEVGRRPHFFKLGEGRYADEVLMCRRV